MATNYYSTQLEKGQHYQDYVAWRLGAEGIVLNNYQTRQAQWAHGENALGMEIKFDDKFDQTGNLWIEVAEKTDAAKLHWVESGIFRNDRAWLYAIGNYVEMFIFSIKRLQDISRQYKVIENGLKTSRGFLLGRINAADMADRVFFWPRGRLEFEI